MMRLTKWLLLVVLLAGLGLVAWLWVEGRPAEPVPAPAAGVPASESAAGEAADVHTEQDRQALERLIEKRLPARQDD